MVVVVVTVAPVDIIKLHLEAWSFEEGCRSRKSGGVGTKRAGARALAAVYINLLPTIHIQVGIHTLSEAALGRLNR